MNKNKEIATFLSGIEELALAQIRELELQVVESDDLDQILLLDIVNVNFAINICDCEQVFVKVPPFIIFVLNFLNTMNIIILSIFVHDVPSDVKLADSDYAFI